MNRNQLEHNADYLEGILRQHQAPARVTGGLSTINRNCSARLHRGRLELSRRRLAVAEEAAMTVRNGYVG